MLSRRRFVAASMLVMASLAGGCVIGGGYEAGPEMDFTIQNLTGSPAMLRFDIGMQSSTRPEIIERVEGTEFQVASGQTMGHTPSPSKLRELRQRASQYSASLVWQVEVRQFGPSWEEPNIGWFELRDTTPMKLTLQTGIDQTSGERIILLRADGQTATPIPREHWPETDSD